MQKSQKLCQFSLGQLVTVTLLILMTHASKLLLVTPIKRPMEHIPREGPVGHHDVALLFESRQAFFRRLPTEVPIGCPVKGHRTMDRTVAFLDEPAELVNPIWPDLFGALIEEGLAAGHQVKPILAVPKDERGPHFVVLRHQENEAAILGKEHVKHRGPEEGRHGQPWRWWVDVEPGGLTNQADEPNDLIEKVSSGIHLALPKARQLCEGVCGQTHNPRSVEMLT